MSKRNKQSAPNVHMLQSDFVLHDFLKRLLSDRFSGCTSTARYMVRSYFKQIKENIKGSLISAFVLCELLFLLFSLKMFVNPYVAA